MSRTRSELMALAAAHRAAAEACERALKDQARRAFDEHGTAERWTVPGVGSLSTPLSQPRIDVVDPERLMDWVQARYPHNVVTVRQVRSQEWLSQVLAKLEPVDGALVEPGEATSLQDEEGTIVPGVVWRPGGRPLSPALCIDPALKRELAAAARAYLDGGPLVLPNGRGQLALPAS